MGFDKAAASLGDRTLLEHVIERCSASDSSCEILISGGPPERRVPGKWRVARDRGGEGPLAGIHALAAEATTPTLVVVACDMPYLDFETLLPLLEIVEHGAEAAFFESEERLEPLPLALDVESAAAAASRLIEAGRLRVIGLADELVAHRRVAPDDPRALANVNTPDDLEAAVKFFASLS